MTWYSSTRAAELAQLVPGFAEVVKQLEALKAKCDVHAAVSVAAQNAREGNFVLVA